MDWHQCWMWLVTYLIVTAVETYYPHTHSCDHIYSLDSCNVATGGCYVGNGYLSSGEGSTQKTSFSIRAFHCFILYSISKAVCYIVIFFVHWPICCLCVLLLPSCLLDWSSLVMTRHSFKLLLVGLIVKTLLFQCSTTTFPIHIF